MKQIWTSTRAKYENAWRELREMRHKKSSETDWSDYVRGHDKYKGAVYLSLVYRDHRDFNGWSSWVRYERFRFWKRERYQVPTTEKQAVDEAIEEENK